MYWSVTDRSHYKRSNKYKLMAYPEDPVEEGSKSIGLPLVDDETDIVETSDEDIELGSDSSDVEKSVMSEDRDDEDGVAILTCAMGPLLSTNVQRPRS